MSRLARRAVLSPKAALVAQAWNPADKSASITLSNSNRTATLNTNAASSVRSVTSRSSGSWHFEMTVISGGVFPVIGLASSALPIGQIPGLTAGNNSIAFLKNGQVYRNNSVVGMVDTFANGDTVAVEFSGSNLYVEKQGGTGRKGPFACPSGSLFAIMYAEDLGDSLILNTGQAAFAITPTSGYSAWG